MESLNKLVMTLEEYLQYLMRENNLINMDTIITCISLIATALVSIFSIVLTYKNANKEFKERRIEKENEIIKKSLEEFYYPFSYMLGVNTQLYSCFALKEKETQNDFRTLIALIDGHEFCDTDKKILGQIIDLNKNINDLILRKGLYVENTEIRKKLVELSTHYTIIELAYQGKIKELTPEYSKRVFPRGINEDVNTEIENIERKLKGVNKK